jgi:hypothetical protein
MKRSLSPLPVLFCSPPVEQIHAFTQMFDFAIYMPHGIVMIFSHLPMPFLPCRANIARHIFLIGNY